MSRAFRLAAAIGFVFVALVPRAEAGPITCNSGDAVDPLFPDAAYRCESVTHHFDPGTNVEAVYAFDDDFLPGVPFFTNHLEFEEVLRPMDITMSAFFVHPGNTSFLSRLPPGYDPALFATSDLGQWIYFRVEDLQDSPGSGPPQQGVDFEGAWTQTIFWIGSSEGLLFNVLHDSRPLESFDATPITVPGSFDPLGVPSPLGPDPAIGGSADDFSDSMVVTTPVPEPATVALTLAGLAGAALARRRAASSTEDKQ